VALSFGPNKRKGTPFVWKRKEEGAPPDIQGCWLRKTEQKLMKHKKPQREMRWEGSCIDFYLKSDKSTKTMKNKMSGGV